ncbi:MAG: hypothetical protein ABW277_07485 [Longimicrobiaceae bacterium]
MDEPRNYIAEVESAVRRDPLSTPAGIKVPAFPFLNPADDAAREEVLSVLVAALEVPNGGTRKTAAFALAQLGDPRPLGVLQARRSDETGRGNIEALDAAISVLHAMPHGSGSTEFERRQAVADVYWGRPLKARISPGNEDAEPPGTGGTSAALSTLTPQSSKLEDLSAFQQAIDTLAPTFSKGSLIAKAIVPVNQVLEHLKSMGFGVPWKLATKAVPPVAAIGDSLASLQRAAERLATPSRTVSCILPSVVESVRARESGVEDTPGLSGQLSTIIRVTSPLRGDLHELSRLTNSTCSVVATVANSMDRLHGIKGIGSLTNSLKDSLSHLEQSLRAAEASNMEVVSASERVLRWLPAYYADVRKAVHSPTACQATVRASFWKKDMCGSSVQWFDDEAPAVCARCGISLCAQHRVEVPSASDSAVRCTWVCVDHSRK